MSIHPNHNVRITGDQLAEQPGTIVGPVERTLLATIGLRIRVATITAVVSGAAAVAGCVAIFGTVEEGGSSAPAIALTAAMMLSIAAATYATNRRGILRVLNGATWRRAEHHAASVGSGNNRRVELIMVETGTRYRPTNNVFDATGLLDRTELEWAGDHRSKIVVRAAGSTRMSLYRPFGSGAWWQQSTDEWLVS